MPIPDAKRASVSPEKVRDYLLNLEHPDGGSKAVWFYALGYRRDQWQELAEKMLEIAQQCTDYEVEKTRFGLKYIVGGLVGPNRKGMVRTVWIQEGADPPRLVTAYPDEVK